MVHITGKIEVSVTGIYSDETWAKLESEYKKDGMTEDEFHHDMLCEFNQQRVFVGEGDDIREFHSELWGDFEDIDVEHN